MANWRWIIKIMQNHPVSEISHGFSKYTLKWLVLLIGAAWSCECQRVGKMGASGGCMVILRGDISACRRKRWQWGKESVNNGEKVPVGRSGTYGRRKLLMDWRKLQWGKKVEMGEGIYQWTKEVLVVEELHTMMEGSSVGNKCQWKKEGASLPAVTYG